MQAHRDVPEQQVLFPGFRVVLEQCSVVAGERLDQVALPVGWVTEAKPRAELGDLIGVEGGGIGEVVEESGEFTRDLFKDLEVSSGADFAGLA
jgi:hypothetical protein